MSDAKGKKAMCRCMAEVFMHELGMYMWTSAVGTAVEALLCLMRGDRDCYRSRTTCRCDYCTCCCSGNCLGIQYMIVRLFGVIFEALYIDKCCNVIDALTVHAEGRSQGWWKKV